MGMVTSGPDVYMNHAQAVALVKQNGMEKFMALMQAEYPSHKLYSCSLAWQDSSKYICKMRGSQGDIIIAWTDDTEHPAYYPFPEA